MHLLSCLDASSELRCPNIQLGRGFSKFVLEHGTEAQDGTLLEISKTLASTRSNIPRLRGIEDLNNRDLYARLVEGLNGPLSLAASLDDPVFNILPLKVWIKMNSRFPLD